MLPVMELALALHTPLYELLENMSFQEFNLWMEYFNQRPIGWREDERTFRLLRAAGVKSNPEALFSSLAAMKKHENKRTPRPVPGAGSFLHTAMMNAKGGVKLDLLEQL